MRLLTLNIWNREGPWKQRLALLHDWFERLQPDLLGLQEVHDLDHVRELCGSERLPQSAGLVEDCQVVCAAAVDGVWPSDHFGVCATLRD